MSNTQGIRKDSTARPPSADLNEHRFFVVAKLLSQSALESGHTDIATVLDALAAAIDSKRVTELAQAVSAVVPRLTSPALPRSEPPPRYLQLATKRPPVRTPDH